ADLGGEIELGAAEGLGRVFEAPVGLPPRLGQFAYQLRRVDGERDNLAAALAEHDVPEHRRGGVVQVDDGARRTFQRLEGAANEIGAGGGEHLDGDVIGNPSALDEPSHEIEVGLRCGRE